MSSDLDTSASRLLRYLKLVQEPGKLESLVLRAHMLSEEHLRTLIDMRLPSPEYFQHKSFGFDQCLSLAKAMYWEQGNDWVWECLSLLNGARNSMAHKSQAQGEESIKAKLERMDLLIRKHSRIPMPRVQRMQWRLASLYASLNKLGRAELGALTAAAPRAGQRIKLGVKRHVRRESKELRGPDSNLP